MNDDIPSIGQSLNKLFKKKEKHVCACPHCGKLIEIRKVE